MAQDERVFKRQELTAKKAATEFPERRPLAALAAARSRSSASGLGLTSGAGESAVAKSAGKGAVDPTIEGKGLLLAAKAKKDSKKAAEQEKPVNRPPQRPVPPTPAEQSKKLELLFAVMNENDRTKYNVTDSQELGQKIRSGVIPAILVTDLQDRADAINQ